MGQRIVRLLAIGALFGATMAPLGGAAGADGSTAHAGAAPAGSRSAWDAAVAAAPQAPPTVTAPAAGRAFAPLATTPTVSVDPAVDLLPGQSVHVTGANLPVGQIVLVECPSGTEPAYSCDLRTLTGTSTDAAGGVTVDFTVHRTIQGAGGRIDCSASTTACDLALADTSANVLARQALAFDPTAPVPHATVTVTPSTGLLAGQTVAVTGAGFVPADGVRIAECAATDAACFRSSTFVETDATGGFSTSFTVGLRVDDGTGTGTATHCLAVACVLQASSQTDLEYQATTPIAFDPGQPIPAPPSITVTPATGLLHAQTVTIAGTGFDPSGFIEIEQCATGEGPFCSEFLAETDTDAAGTFSVTASVTRLVSSFGPTGPDVVDCAPDACSVKAIGFANVGFNLVATAPVNFDASVPPPVVPVVTVTPHADLPYRSDVVVHGTGFSPGESVYADYCADSVQDGTCSTSNSGQADGSGTVDFTLTVKRRLSGGGITPIDCIDTGTRCHVDVQGQHGFERSSIDLTFDPNAPIPPAPVATVTPDHDLGYRQTVDLSGSGFTPGRIPVQQCGPVALGPGVGFNVCTNFTLVDADASGSVTGTMTVRRILAIDGFSIDCATSPTPCTMQIGTGELDETAIVPLGFDPNSQPPPPPVLTITPATHVHDGQTLTVTGTGFTGGAQVGMAPCKAGVTAIADSCDIGGASVATAGPDGSFSTTRTAVGVIQTAEGPFDCTTTPNSCVIAAANASELSEFASAPLSFDVPDIEIHSASVTEGTGMTTMAEVMVELSAPVGSPTTVEWIAFPGTATATDYVQGRGRVTIPAGATEAMIHIDIVGDAVDEPTERFIVAISSAPGLHVTDGTATVKIRDDDAEPTLAIGNALVHEGDGTASVGVMLTAPSSRDVTVEYRTHHRSARSGSDFVRTRGSVTIHAGQLGGVIRIPIVDDSIHERNESFRVELSDADHADIDGRHDTGIVTILDND